MPAWAVQQLRLSLFSTGPVTLTEARHWKLLTGQDEAENRVAIVSGKQYSGKFLDAAVSLSFSGSRCDIVAVVEDSERDPTKPPALPTFGPWEKVVENFCKTVFPFIEGFGFPVNRVAFGGGLLAPADSKEDAYRQLAALLQSVRVDPARMRDFLYRVNWVKGSSVVAGLDLNRLTIWSAMLFTRGVLQMTGTELAVGPPEVSVHGARFEFDLNTSQSHREAYDPTILVPILEELVSMARENAEVGERS
jgi:hypothetical protein